ncbi:phage major capsid protein [Mycolicibacterium neoaurum]|uniref:phage major capsid protein n=1 Tax=Mycolicibacterium neoaurum TaxID=1795 RepID=UPI00248C8783|nr:phage major capsid protein [Mycolicibacterium neoaurum]WBP92923.1 phage major capsid protein [Mycolicibacterium neoaurum]WBS08045.1 phage major capsid protein [Mycolicibacterium neoaurum]
MSEKRGVGVHLDAARDQLLAERVAVAAKVVAAGRFALARMAELGHGSEDLIVDDWELVAAELGAELGISRGRACTLITQGRDLLTRLPAFAEVFGGGAVDLRVLRVILHRCALITDPDIMAVIDAQLAAAAPSWNALSDERVGELIDWMIIDVDPDADADFDELVVRPQKVAGLSIISRELAEDSAPSAQQLVDEGLAQSIATKVDAAFFGNTVTNGPSGLLSVSVCRSWTPAARSPTPRPCWNSRRSRSRPEATSRCSATTPASPPSARCSASR